MSSWLLTLDSRRKVGLYLSDISGAFDRVETQRLLAKLEATGLNKNFLELLRDYLSVRDVMVLVNGAKSAVYPLCNTVFQGTVLGPSLWNVFFQDVQTAAENTGGKEAKFADDLSVSKDFPTSSSNAEVVADLERCRTAVHGWGVKNRVAFDKEKEAVVVLHHLDGEGEDFRLLGLVFDTKLKMHSAVTKLVKRARPKLYALLKTRRYYSLQDLVRTFCVSLSPSLPRCTTLPPQCSTP